MKSINTYYYDRDTLINFIKDNQLVDNASLLIQIFTAFNNKKYIYELLNEIKSILPKAMIIGATTDGEIMDGIVSTQQTVLSFTQFEYTDLKIKMVKHKKDGYYSGQAIANSLIKDNTKLLIAFVDGLHTNGEAFLQGIHSINNTIKVAGGLASDSAMFKQTYVFTNDEIITVGAVAVALNSDRLYIHNDYSFNWQSIGKELTITEVEDNRVYRIGNRTATDTYAHYLGDEIAKMLPEIGIEFPLIVYRHGIAIARAVLGKEDDGSLIFAGNLKVGDKVYFGYGNAKKILNKSYEIFETTKDKGAEAIFVYSCMARRRFMPNDIQAETLPLQQIAPTAGFFTYGEFFTKDSKELLNQTMTLVSLSENRDKSKKKNIAIINSKQLDANTSLNALVHLVTVVRDEIQLQVDTLKGSEKLNKELKERMELALFGSKDGLWDWNILDDTIYISPYWKEMLGFQDHELPNEKSSWDDRIHPDDRESVRNNIIQNLKGESEYIDNTHRLKHKDGHWVWILERGKTLFDNSGKAIRTIGTHTDITKEKEKQLQFRKQAQIIEQIHDSVISIDLDGFITSWNQGAKNLLEYNADEIIAQHISKIFSKEDYLILKEILGVLEEKKEYRTEMKLITKSLKFVDTEFSISLLNDEKNILIGMLIYCQDITQRKEAEDNLIKQKDILNYQAHHDNLTGLPNRTYFINKLVDGLKRAKDNKTQLALFFIDLDHFKQINDSLGHDIGDDVLKIMAQRLQAIFEIDYSLARVGGDEFTIIVNELYQVQDLSLLAEKILKIMDKPIKINGHILYITISIGISLYPQDGKEAQSLIKFADAAMYKAKEEGRNTFQYYSSEMTELAFERIVMTASLMQALEKEEFVTYYQPQIDASNNQLIGMEVLVRWQHPVMGLVSPGKFISLAEETGLIIEIDRWVMKKAMSQFKEWYEKGFNPGRLSLNISFQHLEQNDFLSELKTNIERYGFDTKWLELEITEGQLMKKPDESISTLTKINKLGIAISIDDFGTEYASFAYLKRLPINKIKIDQSFIKEIPNNEEDMAITKAIISLSKSLNLNVIAEGVETMEQKNFLLENGCNNIQGYYYSPPIEAQKIESLYLK